MRVFTKFLSLTQSCKAAFGDFSAKERLLFFIFGFLFASSLLYLAWSNLVAQKQEIPALGGTLKEGIIGELRAVNPLYAVSDIERDISEILFEGLMGYDGQGQIVLELAESFEIKDGGKSYQFILRDGLKWSDGRDLTADDIMFTVKLFQDPAYKSPQIASWLDIGAEKIDQRTVLFRLKKPYYPFLELSTFKIVPKHVWQDIPPQNIHLSSFNLKPVNSGPYLVEKIEQDGLGFIKKLTLKPNPYYRGPGPFVAFLEIELFGSEKDLLKAAASGRINGFSLSPPVSSKPANFTEKTISLPRYFALFLNQEKAAVLKDVRVRKSLAYAIDRKTILQDALKNQGDAVSSPILPSFYGFEPPSQNFDFDLAEAQVLLEQAGFKEFLEDGTRYKIEQTEGGFKFTQDLVQGAQGQEVRELQTCLSKDQEVYPEGQVTGYFGPSTKKAVISFQEKYAQEILSPQGLRSGTGDVKAGTREKLNQLCSRVPTQQVKLSLNLVTVNQPLLEKTAELIKEQLKKAGADIKIKAVPLAELIQEHLKPRNYDLLLFGQVAGIMPDLYPFWHSKQAQDPGLNLAFFKQEQADKLLLEAREAKDFDELKEAYRKFQEIILQESPAVFLYNPNYLYFVSGGIKGAEISKIPDPSKRFSQIESWYFKTKRIFK